MIAEERIAECSADKRDDDRFYELAVIAWGEFVAGERMYDRLLYRGRKSAEKA